MRNKNFGKTRSDRPSGRQASEQPEHRGRSGYPNGGTDSGQVSFSIFGWSNKKKNRSIAETEKPDSAHGKDQSGTNKG